MLQILNCTPHPINVAGVVYPATGILPRVAVEFTEIEMLSGIPVCRQAYGEVEGLPKTTPNTILIVSGMVLSALKGSRADVFAPATGHPLVERNEKGHILSVPCLTQEV